MKKIWIVTLFVLFFASIVFSEDVNDPNQISPPYSSMIDFSLWGKQNLDVNNVHNLLTIYHSAKINILPGAFIEKIETMYARKDCLITVDGGDVNNINLYLYSAQAAIKNGYVNNIFVQNYSLVNIYGGDVNNIDIVHGSTTKIRGGEISGTIFVKDKGNLKIYGHDFEVIGENINNINGKVIGTGVIIGKWEDNTNFLITIEENEETANILLLPKILSDINNDDIVNMIDFAILAKNLSSNSFNINADLDSSGNIDIEDLKILASEWLL
jgi:hypothetical protein